MPFDAFHDWCLGLERDLDPAAKMAHFLQQEIPNALPDPWQVEAITSAAQTVALLVCRQAGKSCVLATRGVRELERGGTTICLAPAERQTREITRKVQLYLRATDLVVERATQTEIECSNGGRFIALPASGATIRGYTADLLLVDEMAYLPGANGGEDVVVALLPMLKDDGQTFYASTPAGKNNLFASLFLEPNDNVHRIKVPGTLIPRLAPRVERLRSQLSATRFRQEVMCELAKSCLYLLPFASKLSRESALGTVKIFINNLQLVDPLFSDNRASRPPCICNKVLLSRNKLPKLIFLL